ncbi:hypothetical protein JIQ42_04228 [Leishmania sp. Namibia]|uniref:hypothetical protein n=1 Tax=Leishmania sp. Namibia TaxID=2802991 RepID=UPI001B3E9D6E|nr:hypothetical protein JIQ42_04228 [Leishmania sp. Namibia]
MTRTLLLRLSSPPPRRHPPHVTVDDPRWEVISAQCQGCLASLSQCRRDAERIVRSLEGALFCASFEATPLPADGANHSRITPPPFSLR